MTSYFIHKSMRDILYNNVVSDVFPSLVYEDKNILTDYLFEIIDIIAIKFNFDEKQKKKYLYQFEQNNYKDAKGLLLTLLPFIKEDDAQTAKKSLKNLSDLYIRREEGSLKVDPLKKEPTYKYTNIQYNRCKRFQHDDKIDNVETKFDYEFLEHNFKLLKESIKTMRNRLYVNWINILPISMANYKETDMFKVTKKQFEDGNLIYWDPYQDSSLEEYKEGLQNRGLDISEVYDTIVNHFYYSIKNIKWTIYSTITSDNNTDDIIPTVQVVYELFNLKKCLNNFNWKQLNDDERTEFRSNWEDFCQSFNNEQNFKGLMIDQVKDLMVQFIESFQKSNQVYTLINSKKYELMYTKAELKKKYGYNTNEYFRNLISLVRSRVKQLMSQSESIYNFFGESFSRLKNTWYGYRMLKKDQDEQEFNDRIYFDDNDFITLKNIYNYAKLISKDFDKTKFKDLPRFWKSFPKNTKNNMINTKNDIKGKLNSIDTPGWFNIQKYIRTYFKGMDKNKYDQDAIYKKVRNILPDVLFEVLIINGVLSRFVPDREITDDRLLPSNTFAKNGKVLEILYNRYKNDSKFKDQINDSYYFVQNKRYSDMNITVRSRKGNQEKKINYVKGIFKSYNMGGGWIHTYALDWISQIIFFHHYLNNRVIFVTGATGVGKSTQIPKLFMYALKMLDYKLNGRVICTQPRKPPTVQTALTISAQMGIPIEEYSEDFNGQIVTSNYNIQYRHQEKEHLYDNQTGIMLKIVTDGSLISDLYLNPLLKKSFIKDPRENKLAENKNFSLRNFYDVVIVDEAHEHNVNMDIILTLMKYSTYFNNDIRLGIVSATLDSDEPRYRRYYRDINDNNIFPLNNYLPEYGLDRINVDRRVHISPPGQSTQFNINEVTKIGTDESREAIDTTIDIINTTLDGDILLFMPGELEIQLAVNELVAKTPDNVLILPYFGKLPDVERALVENIDKGLSRYPYEKTLYIGKPFDNKKVKKVPQNTYKRAIIVATNIAEASITIKTLKYVVDTGTEKVNRYDFTQNSSVLKPEPISDSSRIQRKGRVGRTQDGTVYYMYDVEKLKGIDIKFKITLENIKDTLLKYLINSRSGEDKSDKSFFNTSNDPNVLTEMENVKYDDSIDRIIREQYFIMGEFFSYRGNEKHYDYKNNKMPWLYFRTGMLSSSLTDDSGEFYLVHPDEDLLIRNIYGEIYDVIPRKNQYIFTNKRYESFKIKYFFEILQMYKVVKKFKIELDGEESLQEQYFKNSFGQKITDIQAKIETIAFESVIVYIYSRIYNCDSHIIKLLSMLDVFESPKSIFPDNLPQMMSYLKNQYGDSYSFIIVANMILHLFENKLGIKTYSTSVDETGLKNDMSAFKTKFITAYENKKYAEFKGDKKFNNYLEMFYTGKLFNSTEIKESEIRDSQKNKYIVDHNISKLSDTSVRNYIEQWSSKYGFSPDKIIKFYKTYLKLSQEIYNIDKKIYNEDSTVEIHLEWFDHNLSKDIMCSTLIEKINVCIMYGYFYNIATILLVNNDNYYHVNVFNPSITTIYQVKKLFRKSISGRKNSNDTFLDDQYLSNIIFIKFKAGDPNEINIINHLSDTLITKLFSSLKLENLSEEFSDVHNIDKQRTKIKELLDNQQIDSQQPITIDPHVISTIVPKYIDALQHIKYIVG